MEGSVREDVGAVLDADERSVSLNSRELYVPGNRIFIKPCTYQRTSNYHNLGIL